MGQVAARKLDFRVFLEGVEVPCISANLTLNYDAPAACTVQCIPTPHATRLKPRTSIHVFFKDLVRTDARAPYRLYFMGEIVAYQFAKTPGSLSIIYQALDDSSYWDTAYQYYTDYGRGSDWLFRHKSSFMGSGLGLFDSIFREHASVIGDLLRTSPKTYPQLKGLAGGVVHIIEAVGGIPGKFRGFNDFFTMAEMRRKIMAQIVASEADETSVRIYNYKVFWQWLMRQLGSAGSMVSIRDMIKLLFQYIFHNVVPNPIALYNPEGQQDIRTRTIKRVNTKSGRELLKVLKEAERLCVDAIKASNEAYSLLVNEVIKLRSLVKRGREKTVVTTPNQDVSDQVLIGGGMRTFGTPTDTGDTVTTRQRISEKGLNNLAYNSSISILGTRLQSVRLNYTRAKGIANQRLSRLNQLDPSGRFSAKLAIAINYLATADQVAGNGAKLVANTQGLANRSLLKSVYNPNVFQGASALYAPSAPTSLNRRTKNTNVNPAENLRQNSIPEYPVARLPERATYWADKALKIIQQTIRELGGSTISLSRDFTRRERLHNQIFRPDVWFVAPPRCNVFFPEDYIGFNYSRNFLQEVTRMELTTAMELIGSNIITNQRYVAPNIQDITGKHTLSSSKSGIRLIMPHEIYTGILPRFEFMSEANIYAARGDQKRALNAQAKLIREQQRYLREQVSALRGGKPGMGGDPELIARYEERIKRLQGRAESLEVGGIPYIQRVVNWMFFKKRFSARNMGATCHFTPRAVLGFPGVVINRPKLEVGDVPPHFLGMIAGLTHVASQDGGSTQLSFSEAREHGGQDVDDEFLGLNGGVDQTLRRGQSKTTNRSTRALFVSLANARRQKQKLAQSSASPAIKKNRSDRIERQLSKDQALLRFIVEFERRRAQGKGFRGMRGPNGGVIAKVERGTGTMQLSKDKLFNQLRDISKNNQRLSTRAALRGVTVAEERRLIQDALKNRAEYKGIPLELDYAPWYKIVERFPTIRKRIFLPPEEQIYPTWMSPVYRNEQIGADKINGNRPGIYRQFFGVQAITTDPADSREGRQALQAALADPNRQVSGAANPSKSIGESIDELADAYMQARRNGLDIRSFIDEYTNRPIATLEEIMGSNDLEIGTDGKVIKGKPGFHSFAFGDFDRLEGFRNASAKLISGRGKEGKTARQMDTRKKKLEAVLRYRAELNRGSGQLGG